MTFAPFSFIMYRTWRLNKLVEEYDLPPGGVADGAVAKKTPDNEFFCEAPSQANPAGDNAGGMAISMRPKHAVNIMKVEFPLKIVDEINVYMDTEFIPNAHKHPEIKERMSYAKEIDYLAKLNPPGYLTVSHEDDEVGEQLSTVFLRLAKEYVSHTLGEDKVFTVDIESLYVTRVFSETFDEWQQPTSKPWYSGLTCLFYLKVPPQIESNDDSNEGWSHLRWGSDIEYDDNVLRPSNEEFVKPEVGTLIMFPSWLQYNVVPFSGESECRTLAATISLSMAA